MYLTMYEESPTMTTDGRDGLNNHKQIVESQANDMSGPRAGQSQGEFINIPMIAQALVSYPADRPIVLEDDANPKKSVCAPPHLAQHEQELSRGYDSKFPFQLRSDTAENVAISDHDRDGGDGAYLKNQHSTSTVQRGSTTSLPASLGRILAGVKNHERISRKRRRPADEDLTGPQEEVV